MPKLQIVEVASSSRPSRTNGRARTRRKKKFPKVFCGVTLPQNLITATDINSETMFTYVDEMTTKQRQEACATIKKMEDKRFVEMLQKFQEESSMEWLKDLVPSVSFTKVCVVITG